MVAVRPAPQEYAGYLAGEAVAFGMEFRLLGWPEDGPTLNLDHRHFRYAGKFVMSSTGKLVAEAPPPSTTSTDATRNDASQGPDAEILGATAFDADRTDSSVLRIRYVTVRDDRRGDGIGTRLLERTVDLALDRGYESVAIAVNNPYAYVAATRAGFGFDGETTGIAELVLTTPAPEPDRYLDGLEAFLERDLELSTAERAYVRHKLATGPPPERSDPR